jgi:hypothetical protein
LDSKLGADTEKATTAWLEGALEHAYSHDQYLALACLEAVMEDVVFEQEIAARRASHVDSAGMLAPRLTYVLGPLSGAGPHAEEIATITPMRRGAGAPVP